MKYITNVSKISSARLVMDMHHYYSGLRTFGMRARDDNIGRAVFDFCMKPFRKWRKASRFTRFVCSQVRYAPKVSLSKIDRIVEGSELKFKCRAEANPPILEYR